MQLSLETFPLILLFLVPGFVAHYTKEYLSTTPEVKLGAFAVTMLSLVKSLIVFIAEGWVFVVVLEAYRYDFSFVIDKGIAELFKSYPVGTFSLGAVWLILGIALGYLLGRYDPLEYIFRRVLAKRGLTSTNIWSNTFENRRQHWRKQRCFVTVHMKSGDIYTGCMVEYSLMPDDDGHREFVIDAVTYHPSIERKNINGFDYREKYRGRSAVLINNRAVDSIDIVYENEI